MTAYYAFLVRGNVERARDAVQKQGLQVEVEPGCTAVQGWLPDQAALFGILARVRVSGLDLIEVRRLPDEDPR